MRPNKFAKSGNWAEISEMKNKTLRRIIYEFAEEYHRSEILNSENTEKHTNKHNPFNPTGLPTYG